MQGEKWSGYRGEENLKSSEEYVWNTHAMTRGIEIHQRLGQNLPYNFPSIRKFEAGKITGMISIDLTANTYVEDIRNLERLLKRKIDEVAKFEGASLRGITISKEDITEREVLIIFPKPESLITDSVRRVIEKYQNYAINQGVDLQIIHFGVLQGNGNQDEVLENEKEV
jgi:hypothetical protein